MDVRKTVLVEVDLYCQQACHEEYWWRANFNGVKGVAFCCHQVQRQETDQRGHVIWGTAMPCIIASLQEVSRLTHLEDPGG